MNNFKSVYTEVIEKCMICIILSTFLLRCYFACKDIKVNILIQLKIEATYLIYKHGSCFALR